jgi:hypothetical protein
MLFIRLCQTDDDQKIGVEVPVVERPNDGTIWPIPNQKNGCSRGDEELRQSAFCSVDFVVCHTLVAASTGASASTNLRSSGLVSS